MDFLREADKLDEIVPGVSGAYRALRDSHGQGIYTSLGRYYNHTIFGRDAGMSAKFVSDFDHQTVWDTILTLASYQGRDSNLTTQEQLGRIHHELRDFAQWQGRWYDRFGLWWAARAWGVKNKQLRTYFAADTTATYIRLVHKYATHIDPSVLERQVPQRDGSTLKLTESITLAANWIVEQIDDTGVFTVKRTNRWSLPYQTFCDSVTAYAWNTGSPTDASRAHSFIEVQAYALDALEDAAHIVPDSPDLHRWRYAIDQMQKAIKTRFYDAESGWLYPGLFEQKGALQPLDTPMVTSGWALNASFWQHMDETERAERIGALVKRLFADDFLTEVGLRTKSLQVHEPLGNVLDYHGSQTVWPMFNFMVIEGLRRHGLYRLARQLECRVLNGINAIGNFTEFMIVDKHGKLHTPDRHAKHTMQGQMIPEQNIAFTVVPSLTLAFRHLYRRHDVMESGWQHDLEEEILGTISSIELHTPNEARERLAPKPVKIRRTVAGFKSAWHIAPVILKRP